jgi:hypothetical protein
MTDQVQTARKEIVRCQISRFHDFYASYFNRADTRPMVEYFFDRVYSLEEDQDWRKTALTTFKNVRHLVAEETRSKIEHLLELHDLTDCLDRSLAEILVSQGWDGRQLSLEEYRAVYVLGGRAEDRARHLNLVFQNMVSFYALAHRPVNGMIIKPARFMTKMLGIYSLFAPVEQGYYAVLPVSRELFDEFIAEVQRREWEYLNSAFPTHRLSDAAI